MQLQFVVFIVNMLLKISVQSKSQYLRLYLAALEGNWQDANQILTVEAVSDAIQYSITRTNESILHVAFASKHMAFIKGVVKVLSDDHLELKNVDGDTALCFAAKSGIVPIAKLMVKKNNKLPLIRSSEGRTPLHQAALLGRRDMVSYLFTETCFEGLSPDERMDILVATISHDMYGMPHISIIVSLSQILKNFIISIDVLTEILIGHETFENDPLNCFYGQI